MSGGLRINPLIQTDFTQPQKPQNRSCCCACCARICAWIHQYFNPNDRSEIVMWHHNASYVAPYLDTDSSSSDSTATAPPTPLSTAKTDTKSKQSLDGSCSFRKNFPLSKSASFLVIDKLDLSKENHRTLSDSSHATTIITTTTTTTTTTTSSISFVGRGSSRMEGEPNQSVEL